MNNDLKILRDCLTYFLGENDRSMSKQNRALLFVDMWSRVKPLAIAKRYLFKGFEVTIFKNASGNYSIKFVKEIWYEICPYTFNTVDEAIIHAEFSILASI